MTQDLFRVLGGVQIDDGMQILEGVGAPSLDAPLGSIYSDKTAGDVGHYLKVGAGVGLDKWVRLASTGYVQQTVSASISWREPVVAADLSTTTIPTGTPGDPITVDGVSVTNGDRVLFAALTGGNGKNVYVYDQAAGTFTEDNNQESAGDTVYVQGGSEAGKTFNYTGTSWILINQTSLTEFGYINAFVGKSGLGAELPDYSSTNQIADGQSLETAIGNLDASIGADIGGTPNQITPSSTVFGNIGELDAAIGPDVSPTNSYVVPTNSVNANLQVLDAAIGAPVTNGTAVLAANTVNQNIQALDSKFGVSFAVVSGVATASDTAPVGVGMAKWLVKIVDGTNVRAEEVFAVAQGSNVDFTRYGVVKLGSVGGTTVNVTVVGGQMQIAITGPAGSNITIKRIAVV